MPINIPFNTADTGGRKTIIVLCVDTSNSLFSKQRNINKAIKAFLNEVDNDVRSHFGTEVAVVAYDKVPRIHSDFTINKSTIPPISIPLHNENGGWTDIGAALSFSIELAKKEWTIQKSFGNMVNLPWVILFTDGRPESRDGSAKINMEKAIKTLRSWEVPNQRTDKVHYIGIGIGDCVDRELMERISVYGPSRYKHADNFAMLSKLFKFAGATTVTNNRVDIDDAESFISPKRTVLSDEYTTEVVVQSPLTEFVPESTVASADIEQLLNDVPEREEPKGIGLDFDQPEPQSTLSINRDGENVFGRATPVAEDTFEQDWIHWYDDE